ncbi:chorion peroxidase-like [Neocloeon triangulifer]|uniref:chorion peroxidase-like n=1 Tax=Neocloeon triangulifer TaxID=2078957 RepID=UPI00286EDFAA|nr:chorion peroxidase-like [Neocloeon triangulifer]
MSGAKSFVLLLVAACVTAGQVADESFVFPTEESTTEFEESITINNKESLSPLAKCVSENEMCKPPSRCALFYADEDESKQLQSCILSPLNETANATFGLCCEDVVANRLDQSLPAVAIEVDTTYNTGPELNFVSADDLTASSDNGMSFKEKLENFENKVLPDMGIKVEKDSPSAGHLKVFNTTAEARELAVQALQLAAATSALTNRLGIANPSGELRQVGVQSTQLGQSCPPLPNCSPRLSKYRIHDGTCNNPRRSWVGRATSPLQRLLPAHYDDGIQVPRSARDGGPLPSARQISFILSTDGNRAPLDRRLSALVADFGQFLDHDVVQSPSFQLRGGGGIQCCTQDGSAPLPPHQRHPQCMPIEIPFNDPFFSRFRQGCMNFVRTMPALTHNCSLGAINQMNSVSHWLDGSMLYGSDGQTARNLVGPRGTLLSSGNRGSAALLPSQSGGCTQRGPNENPNFCFASGDSRVNEQPLLSSLHTLFMREHNRVAAILAGMHPEYSDDAVYQEARRIVVGQLQHIAYNEFLPVVLGRRFMETYGLLPLASDFSTDYNFNYDASITNEFAAAAYRLHTLVRGDLRLSTASGESRLPLRETLNSPQVLFWPDAGDALLAGQCGRPLGAFDHVFSEELTQHLFQGRGSFGLDILSLNIQRGRDHGLPGYNSYRKLCGLKRARDFTDLTDTIKPEALQVLRRIYRSVDDIDLYVGGISERRSSGALLGHTFLCLVGDQFARLKKGDRFFYDLGNQPSSFTLEQLNEIRKTSLARIICDNSAGLTRIQPLVFWQQDDSRNPIVSCDSSLIPRVSLDAWIREVPDS